MGWKEGREGEREVVVEGSSGERKEGRREVRREGRGR